MIDNLLGGGDDGDSEDSSTDTDMGGGLFDESESGDDLMGGGDDLMGDGDDLMGGDDDMAFGEMDEDGGTTSAEMDNRIDELENEVASLSSTVSTVKSENELISESVDDVEENIRKLLEVYEMVTRGVNPFVDESEMGNVFGSEGGGNADNSMGLFGDGETNDATEGDVDDSIADADADEFFDDDLDDDEEADFDDFDDEIDDEIEDEGGLADDEFGEFDDEDEFGDDELEDEFGDEPFDEDVVDDESAGGDGGGGKSFEELKAEYDSGEADWDESESSTPDEEFDEGIDETTDEGIDETTDEGIDESDADTVGDLEHLEDAGESEFDEFVGSDETPNGETAAEASSRERTDRPVASGKPYLEALPSGYVADIVVMDWLEFLVEEAGIDGAARTIAYYEAIEWIDEPAADSLQTFLAGFGGEIDPEPEPRSALTVSHHNTSLRFISRIVNPDLELVSTGGEPPWENRTERVPNANRTNGIRRPNGRLGSTRSPTESGHEPSRGRYEIESDGGRDRPGAGAAAFDWVDERRE